MSKYLPFIKRAINTLEKSNLLIFLDHIRLFHDEPKIYFYTARANTSSANINTKLHNYVAQGTGYSFTSQEEALSKCLGEILERMCALSHNVNSITYKSLKKLNTTFNIFDYPAYTKSSNMDVLGWVDGFNLSLNEKCMLPAQLIYYSYLESSKEKRLVTNTSTGAAGGFDHMSVLMSGIYEVVERDAFMTIYLGSIKPKRINPNTIPYKSVTSILDILDEYYYDYYIFDITSDLEIPVFLTIIVDKTGVGPALSVGLKSGFNIEKTLKNSIEETFLARNWLRKRLMENQANPELKVIDNLEKRGLLWSKYNQLNKLKFMLNQPPVHTLRRTKKHTLSIEYKKVMQILKEKNHSIFYKDISNDLIKKCDYRVYKIIIPTLQPFYTNELDKEIRLDRIKTVSEYYKQPYKINNTPHPFL